RRCAKNASTTTMRIGKAALRKKRLTISLVRGYEKSGAPDQLRGYQGQSRALRAFGQRGHVREVAEMLVVIEAVADREPVRDLEADVANLVLDPSPLGL